MGSKFPYRRTVKSVTEVVAETLGTPPIGLFNKLLMRRGRRRYINVGPGAYIYVFTRDNDKSQTATITDYVDLGGSTADRDWDDSTFVGYNISGGTTVDLRLYDYGSVKERFAYALVWSNSPYATSYVSYSEDGSTWYTLVSVAGAAVSASALKKVRFRYLKWWGKNTSSDLWTIRVMSVEVFDPDDYTYRVEGSYIVDMYDIPLWIIIDAPNPVYYYAYDVSDVKVTLTEGDVEL
jgi:hypothetical protein